MNRSRKSTLLLTGLGLVLPLTMILSIGTGPVSIPALDIISVLLDRLGLVNSELPDDSGY